MFTTITRWLLPLALGTGLVALGIWHWQQRSFIPPFEAGKYTEEQLLEMELEGEIVRAEDETLSWNPDRIKTFPSPAEVWQRVKVEFSDPTHTKGANDHGIGRLVGYTVWRFFVGFALAAAAGVLLGTTIGLSPFLFRLLNPYIQMLKPISPLAWMPLLLYSVKDPFWTVIFVVFLAALWPVVANTAFGVQSMRKEYLQVARMLELSWARQLFGIILPASAPAVVAGLRIAFGSALIAVVPAEMLLGELGVGYLTWNYWNNLDLAGVLFAILVIGVLGVLLDLGFQRVARFVSFAE